MENSDLDNLETRSIAAISRALDGRYASPHELCLEFGGWVILLRSNSAPLLESLREYYGDLAQSPPQGGGRPRSVDVLIRIFETEAQEFGFAFRKLKREAGKSSKVQFFDVPDGRVVLKMKSRIQYLL